MTYIIALNSTATTSQGPIVKTNNSKHSCALTAVSTYHPLHRMHRHVYVCVHALLPLACPPASPAPPPPPASPAQNIQMLSTGTLTTSINTIRAVTENSSRLMYTHNLRLFFRSIRRIRAEISYNRCSTGTTAVYVLLACCAQDTCSEHHNIDHEVSTGAPDGLHQF